MTKISTQPFAFSTLASASALAFAITSTATPAATADKVEEARTIRFEYTHTSPSSESLQVTFKQASPDSFENRVSNLYSTLAASQTELGPEYEALLLNKLSDLYED